MQTRVLGGDPTLTAWPRHALIGTGALSVTYNRIVHHGIAPAAEYAKIPNSLIRDGSVSADAYRVLTLLLSHEPGKYGESKQSIARQYGWTWRRASGAVAELEAGRFLVVQRHVTSTGTRSHETYHVSSRRFAEDKYEVLCRDATYAENAHCPDGIGAYAGNADRDMSETHITPMSETQNIEDQPEDQPENKKEQRYATDKANDARSEGAELCSCCAAPPHLCLKAPPTPHELRQFSVSMSDDEPPF